MLIGIQVVQGFACQKRRSKQEAKIKIETTHWSDQQGSRNPQKSPKSLQNWGLKEQVIERRAQIKRRRTY